MKFPELSRHLRHLAGLPVRGDDVGPLLDTFILLAIGTILVVRIFLWLTGYPQIGGGKLHIAHMLWGGLLMLLGLILMQSIITRWARHWGCTLGGIGFGLFIDELGKFITKDNDYFFRPTYAIIYVMFVLFYLATRSVLRAKKLSPHEALVNAIEYVKEGAVNELDEKDKGKALALLLRADLGPLTSAVRSFLENIEALPSRSAFFWERWARALSDAYFRLAVSPAFTKGVAVLFLATALLGLWSFQSQIVRLWEGGNLGFTDWAVLISGTVTTVFVIIGDTQLLRGKRLPAFRWFEKSLLIFLLVNQVFVFVRVQLIGILQFILVLLIYVGVRYSIVQEERREVTLAVGETT